MKVNTAPTGAPPNPAERPAPVREMRPTPPLPPERPRPEAVARPLAKPAAGTTVPGDSGIVAAREAAAHTLTSGAEELPETGEQNETTEDKGETENG